MKIALFKDQYGTRPLEEIFESYDGYSRVSEYVDIEFRILPPEVTVAAELKRLDKAEVKLREAFQEKLDEIETSRANLRALTHTVQE